MADKDEEQPLDDDEDLAFLRLVQSQLHEWLSEEDCRAFDDLLSGVENG